MTSLAKSFAVPFRLPAIRLPRWSIGATRRRRATIDLIHSSPHLLRDIGVADGRVIVRGR